MKSLHALIYSLVELRLSNDSSMHRLLPLTRSFHLRLPIPIPNVLKTVFFFKKENKIRVINYHKYHQCRLLLNREIFTEPYFTALFAFYTMFKNTRRNLIINGLSLL